MTSQANESTCAICLRQPKQADELGQTGTIVYCDRFWVIRHSQETNILGYFLLEARRHYLDLSHATSEEAEAYGPLLARLMHAIRQVTDCERVYTFSLGEAVPHYHLHVIPRTSGLPRGFRGRGIMSYPVNPPADSSLVEQVCQRIRRILSCSTVAK